MAAPKKYPDELRERAVKMVLEIRERDGKGLGELARVARQLGVHPEALRSWVKQDLGVLPPRLPPRQAQQRHGTGDNQEDQLQAHKPKIIPRPG
jgi:transposase